MAISRITRAALGVAGALVLAAPALQAQAVIASGNVTLGVNSLGHLNYAGVGLASTSTGNESTYPGCECEGWGVGIAGGTYDGRRGYANDAVGTSGLTLVSFSSTATTAKSVTTISDGSGNAILRITHDYMPSASSFLYEVKVTLENLSGQMLGDATNGLRYRRVMDWDIEPTAFSELVTLSGWGATSLLAMSNDGFESSDPFSSNSAICGVTSNTNIVDSGPCDHGAAFDFGFAGLAAGASFDFTTFYGVAPTETQMLAALGAVGAENVYSFGQSSTTRSCVGGAPAGSASCETFAFGFKGVGGTTLPDPTAVPEPSTVILLGTGLLAIGGVARRRRRQGK